MKTDTELTEMLELTNNSFKRGYYKYFKIKRKDKQNK